MTARLAGWLARHRPAFRCRTTYDVSHPWLLSRYRIPDALAWLIGFSVIRTDCLICGAHQLNLLRVWCADPEVGKQQYREIVARHRHTSLRWSPMYWRQPMGNYRAWEHWRQDHHSLN